MWLLVTGVCAASGIWATHFVAMLAYEDNLPTAYDPGLTAASLVIAIIATTAGFSIASFGSRMQVLFGGAVIGLGISLMHFTGMKALIIGAISNGTGPTSAPRWSSARCSVARQRACSTI